MIATALLLLAGALPAPAPAPASALQPVEQRPPMAAYVARVLGVQDVPSDCVGHCWEFHPGFELELQPVEVLAGEVAPGARRARHYSHAGFPEFAHYEHALVFEFAAADGALLSRTAFPVALSTGGRWTYCADDDQRENVRDRGRQVRFTGPIRRNERTRRFGEDYFRYGASDVGKRSCRRGIHADELVAIHVAEVAPQGRMTIEFRSEERK